MSNQHHSSSYQFFNTEFEKETDRAKVILSAAMLDEALLAFLKAFFVPNASNSDSLFDGPNAPMSTFSSRIDFSYRLGLISKRFSRDLHIIRRIRNEFAHNVSGCNFETTSVSGRIAALRQSFSELIQNEEKVRQIELDNVKQFQFIVGWSIWYLWNNLQDIKCQKESDEEWAYLPQDATKS